MWASSQVARVKITINVLPEPLNQFADFVTRAHTHAHTCVYELQTSLQDAWHTLSGRGFDAHIWKHFDISRCSYRSRKTNSEIVYCMRQTKSQGMSENCNSWAVVTYCLVSYLWSRWEDNIKMDLQEVGRGCGDWMGLAEDRDRWRALVSTVMNFRVP